MNNYTLIFDTYKITIQRAAYIEDGGFIEIIGNSIMVYEIPTGGGVPILISECETLSEAILKMDALT